MWSEFREFLLKANVLSLALAFIIGVALAAVVNSLVADIIMPPVGMALGGADIQNMFIDLSGKNYPTLKAAKDGHEDLPALRLSHPGRGDPLPELHQRARAGGGGLNNPRVARERSRYDGRSCRAYAAAGDSRARTRVMRSSSSKGLVT